MAELVKTQNSTAPGIALAHTIYGDLVTATARENSTGSGVGPATWSTAPYVEPARRAKDNRGQLCGVDGCRAYPAKKSGFDVCVGHARQAGLIATCAEELCNKPAPAGGTLCKTHNDDAG